MKPFIVKCRGCGDHWIVILEMEPIYAAHEWLDCLDAANRISYAIKLDALLSRVMDL